VRLEPRVWAAIEELRTSLAEARDELHVQFKRIAQLQAEVDELRHRLGGQR
jgi:hypothetical protein